MGTMGSTRSTCVSLLFGPVAIALLDACSGSDPPTDPPTGADASSSAGGGGAGAGGGGGGTGGTGGDDLCPVGQAPADDGACQPVGIQGCAPLFIDPDGICRP